MWFQNNSNLIYRIELEFHLVQDFDITHRFYSYCDSTQAMDENWQKHLGWI